MLKWLYHLLNRQFFEGKDIIQQLKIWPLFQIKLFIKQINDLELLIKRILKYQTG